MRTFKFWLLYGLSIFFLLAVFACMTMLVFTAQMWLRESRDIAELPLSIGLTGQHVETRDARIFVLEQGRFDHAPVVFVHGAGAWGGIWGINADFIAQNDFRAMTLDLPPFGFSQRLRDPDSYATGWQALRLLDVLEKTEAKGAVLVCHGLGCRPAMEAAIIRPAAVKKLVLVAPTLGFSGDRKKPQFDRTPIEGFWRILFQMKQLRNSVLATYGTSAMSTPGLLRLMVHDPLAVTAGRVALLQAPMQINYSTQAIGDWLENALFASGYAHVSDFGNFARLRMPVLVVWGRQDRVTPLWQGEALEKMLPDAVLSVFDQAGHMPFIENPNAFNKALLNFLRDKPLDAR